MLGWFDAAAGAASALNDFLSFAADVVAAAAAALDRFFRLPPLPTLEGDSSPSTAPFGGVSPAIALSAAGCILLIASLRTKRDVWVARRAKKRRLAFHDECKKNKFATEITHNPPHYTLGRLFARATLIMTEAKGEERSRVLWYYRRPAVPKSHDDGVRRWLFACTSFPSF